MNLPRTFHQARRLLGSSDLLASPFISLHLPKCMQARRLLGSSAPLREAMSKLAGLEKEEKQRQRLRLARECVGSWWASSRIFGTRARRQERML